MGDRARGFFIRLSCYFFRFDRGIQLHRKMIFLLGWMFLNFYCQSRILGHRFSLEAEAGLMDVRKRECQEVREVREELKCEETLVEMWNGSRRLKQESYFKVLETSICESGRNCERSQPSQGSVGVNIHGLQAESPGLHWKGQLVKELPLGTKIRVS